MTTILSQVVQAARRGAAAVVDFFDESRAFDISRGRTVLGFASAGRLRVEIVRTVEW
jgi:hypothetical protein